MQLIPDALQENTTYYGYQRRITLHLADYGSDAAELECGLSRWGDETCPDWSELAGVAPV